MKTFGLSKRDKLCSQTAIDSLFERIPGAPAASRAMAYPVRAVWCRRRDEDTRPRCPQFIIMVPKRRLRHAVDRVRMRRLVREAYRLNRQRLSADLPVDIAFVYVADSLLPFHTVERSVKRLLDKIEAAKQ